MRFLSFVLFLVSVSLSGAGAFGQSNSSFYVSKTGDDSNPGAQAAPWRTIQHAADTVRAGSTVNVRGGIYEERLTIKASGNATDGYITFRSYPGETAVLDAEHLVPDGRSGILTIHIGQSHFFSGTVFLADHADPSGGPFKPLFGLSGLRLRKGHKRRREGRYGPQPVHCG